MLAIVYAFFARWWLLVWVFGVMADQPHHYQILYHIERSSLQQVRKQIQELTIDSICVAALTYASDVILSRQEFLYLIGFKEGDTITSQQLYALFFYLSKKHLFERITVSLSEREQGYAVHVDLEAFWTFNALKFKSIFVGKERIKQYYLMNYQDRFDKDKHADSVQNIKDACKAEGFFDVQVHDLLIYRQETKTIDVRLDVRRGPRFFIQGVSVVLDYADQKPPADEHLQSFLQEHLAKRLVKSYYAQEQLALETAQLRQLLVQEGYCHIDLLLGESVHHQDKTVQLEFRITLHNKKQFLFVGNRFFSDAQLREHITAFGRAVTLLPASILAEELTKLYYDKGFWQVSMHVDDEAQSCRFTIDEGERSTISQIQIQAADSFQEAYLIKRFFRPLLKKRFYEVTLQQECIDRCLSYMIEQGFWQARMHSVAFEQVTAHAYKLIITFDMGQQRCIESVKIEHEPDLSDQGPFQRFCQGYDAVPVSPEILDEQRQWLKHYFKKQGYTVQAMWPEISGPCTQMQVTWRSTRGARIEDQKVVVLGSSTFPFSYVQRELQYAIGDRWHQDTMRSMLARLKKIELFESVNLIPDKLMPDDPASVLLLKLQQDDPYEIRMRTGFGIQHITKSFSIGGLTYRIGGSCIYKNITNAGDQLRLDADCTRAIRLVNLQYRRPWLFGIPMNGMFQGYTNRFEYPGFIGSQLNLYTVIQQGCLVNINGVYDKVDAALSTGIEWVDTHIDESTPEQAVFAHQVARAINFKPELLDKNIPFFLIQPTCILYYVDSTINPTKGTFGVFSAKALFPLSSLQSHAIFVRLLAEQSFFIPLLPFVIALRVRCGHIFNMNFSTIVPIERFYLGGANSIRSYETDQCPPLGKVCHEGKELYVPQGGKSLVNLNAELRFPLYKQLGGALFADIGALSNNRLADIRAQDLLTGIGFGLRYNTPIGPLRFDIAWRGNKHDGVGRGYAWFMSFGNAFM